MTRDVFHPTAPHFATQWKSSTVVDCDDEYSVGNKFSDCWMRDKDSRKKKFHSICISEKNRNFVNVILCVVQTDCFINGFGSNGGLWKVREKKSLHTKY